MKRISLFLPFFLNENNIMIILKRNVLTVQKTIFITHSYISPIFEKIRLCYIAYACLSKNKIAKQ